MSGTERLINFPPKTTPVALDGVYVADSSNAGNEVYVTISQLLSSGGSGIVLLVANNLSDLASPSTARTNLGLGTAAVQNVAFFLQTANNLSDLASASTARTNLGLGTAAVQNVAFFLQTANNLSDLASASTARTNLGLGSAAVKAASGSGSTVASITGSITIGHVATFADTSGTIQDGGATSQFLIGANNLSDVANATTSRTNLGLGTAATKTSSSAGATYLAAISGAITSGHYAQFSDSVGTLQDGGAEPAGVLLAANNLSDVNSASTSRTNLGLGTAAVEAATFFLQVANNLSDLNSASSARTNLGLGTAATKTSSSAGATYLAAITGAISMGHYAQFSDTVGTLQDGGATPAGVLLAANNLSDVNSASTSRTNLGLAIGTNVEAWSSVLDAVAAGTYTGATSITTLGTIATGTWAATAVAVLHGGSGATTASGARTNLGLAIGTNVQAWSASLDQLAAITPSQGDIIYYNGTSWVRLAAGTSGYFLKTQGASANPVWAAVSQPTFNYVLSSSSGNFSTASTSAVAVTNLSVSITTTGGPVYVQLVADGTANNSYVGTDSNVASQPVLFYRGVTLVGQPTMVGIMLEAPSGFAVFDTPTAGTYTYSVQTFTSNGAAPANLLYCKLLAYEMGT